MKESKQPSLKQLLKPYREQIDQIDDMILELMAIRFGVVKEVAKIKHKSNITAFIGERVAQVRDRCTKQAKKYGMDEGLNRTLYTLIIYQSCATEDLYKHEVEKKLAEKKKKK
jgi:chorismate mutase